MRKVRSLLGVAAACVVAATAAPAHGAAPSDDAGAVVTSIRSLASGFFDIDESQHPGVDRTGSSDGPEIASGRALKAAVPNSQRFGPGLAPGTSTRDVIGVGVDGRARLDSLQLAGTDPVPLRFAVGGAPILRDGAPLPGVDAKTAAVRTGAGISSDQRHLYLVVLDGISATNTGMTLAELAGLLEDFGARAGVNLDGGGSSTCAVQLPGSSAVTVFNVHPGGVAERPVANGIGMFSH